MAPRWLVNDKSITYDGVRIIKGADVVDDEWAEKAKRLLRSEMVKRGVSYEELAVKLSAMGVVETPVNLRNKVARGKFMALFMLQCFVAIGAQTIRLEEP
jgi:hypothetical protein